MSCSSAKILGPEASATSNRFESSAVVYSSLFRQTENVFNPMKNNGIYPQGILGFSSPLTRRAAAEAKRCCCVSIFWYPPHARKSFGFCPAACSTMFVNFSRWVVCVCAAGIALFFFFASSVCASRLSVCDGACVASTSHCGIVFFTINVCAAHSALFIVIYIILLFNKSLL